MKTAVVTGAGGFIGGALTRKLLDKGWIVYGIDVKPIENKTERFVPLCMDLNDGELIKAVGDVDTVFHLAWGGSLKGADIYDAEVQTENILTTVNFFKNIAEKCRRFLFCGSSYEYMRDLTSGTVPMCEYGTAKRAAADMCASMAYRKKIDFVKVVLTNTFGVGDRSDKAVNTIVGKMIDGEELKLVEGNQKNDWTYVDDTVDGLIAAAEKGKDFKEYYIGHRKITTFREKIETMRDLLRPEMELTFGTMSENTYIDYSAIALDLLYEDTGFLCKTEFEDAIRMTEGWVKKMKFERAAAFKNASGGGGIT